MYPVGATVGDIGALNAIAELTFGQAGLEPVAQPGHAPITEMRSDAQPLDLLRRFDLTQAHIGAIEVDDLSEALGEDAMLLEGHRADHADAPGAGRAPLQHLHPFADRGFPAPSDIGLF